MLALIYLGLAIVLGDLLCRRFYDFVSVPHRWAAAALVGILVSIWFTYLAVLALSHTSGPLLFADLLFFVLTPYAIFWLRRKAPEPRMIAPRTPGSQRWDWVTLGALFSAACVLLVGTLYLDKQGHLRVAQSEELVRQLSTTQTFVLSHSLPTRLSQLLAQRPEYQLLFYLQAANLDFLGLNLAWSTDLLSVLGLTSTLALVIALGELLFDSSVVGRLGATVFFFHGWLQRTTDFLAAGHGHRDEIRGFWKQIAFVDHRYLPFATGILLLVLTFVVDQYRQRQLAASRTGLRSTIVKSGRPAVRSASGFVFSGLLLAALPLWNGAMFIASAVVLCCLFVAYGCWRLSRMRTAAMLGQAIGGTLIACIFVAGAVDFLAVYDTEGVNVKYDDESLVQGLVFRRAVIYQIPTSFGANVASEESPKVPATAFEGGHGGGKGQFEDPRGIATDTSGNIFVADTGNGRIEKFSANGAFVTSRGQLEEPNGIAVDRAGNIYVTEVGSKHCVQKLGPDGKFIARWAPALYGPRKIAIGSDDSVYVVDSGRSRIVKFSPTGQVLASWGSEGTRDGQFRGVSSVAVDPINNKVYAADPMNSRIQVFDLDGRFLSKWSVPEWGQPLGFEDVVIDSSRNRLYASSGHMDSVLVFDLSGARLGTVAARPPNKLQEPGALALFGTKLYVLSHGGNRVVPIDL